MHLLFLVGLITDMVLDLLDLDNGGKSSKGKFC